MSDKPSQPFVIPPGVQLQIDDDVAQGMYSNLQIAGNNDTEFVIDFAYIQPQQPRGKVRARVILSPRHAKTLLHLLAERVRDYESRFGPIPAPVPVVIRNDGGGSGQPN